MINKEINYFNITLLNIRVKKKKYKSNIKVNYKKLIYNYKKQKFKKKKYFKNINMQFRNLIKDRIISILI